MKRRDLLKGAAALLLIRDALAQGRLEKGVYRLRGNVHINGADAQRGGELRPGDALRTQPGAEIVFVSQTDAFLVRQNSEVSLVANGLRIVTGAVLARAMPEAYRLYRNPREVRTSVIYMEAQQARRASLAALIGMPIIWLVILLSSFGLIGRSQF